MVRLPQFYFITLWPFFWLIECQGKLSVSGIEKGRIKGERIHCLYYHVCGVLNVFLLIFYFREYLFILYFSSHFSSTLLLLQKNVNGCCILNVVFKIFLKKADCPPLTMRHYGCLTKKLLNAWFETLKNFLKLFFFNF